MMKTIKVNVPNKIYLEDSTVGERCKVAYSVLNELGQYVADVDGNSLEAKTAKYDRDGRNFFYAQFTLPEDVKGKYFRLSFTILSEHGIYVISSQAVQDLIVEKTTSSQLVPPSYFRDYVLNGDLDDEIKNKIEKYPDDGLREWLTSSAGEIENELEISLTPRKIELECHDWFQDNMRETHWMQQLYHFPIISVESYSLWYGDEKIVEIQPQYLSLNKEMGIIEYLPTSAQPFSMIFYSLGIEATQFALVARGYGSPRLPNAFKISYTHGIDYLNLAENDQADIRMGICRRAMLKGLARISPEVITGNVQQSVDGASYGIFYKGMEWLNLEKLAEDAWMSAMKRKYNTHLKTIAI